ncbi:MAG: ATP-binding protein [Pseudomonadota bacterium]
MDRNGTWTWLSVTLFMNFPFTNRLTLQHRTYARVSLVVAGFILAMSFTLDRVFQNALQDQVSDRLKSLWFTLAAQLEPVENSNLVTIPNFADPRLSVPGSGLFAAVYQPHQQSYAWISRSFEYRTETAEDALFIAMIRKPTREGQLEKINLKGKQAFFIWQQAVVLEERPNHPWLISVIESQADYQSQIRFYRWVLASVSLIIAIILLVITTAVLRWSFKPLRQLEKELSKVEHGEVQQFSEHYPRELQGLVSVLNRFMDKEREQRQRYGQVLENTAHSLKTRLTVLKNTLQINSFSTDEQNLCRDQVQQMEQLLAYHLQRTPIQIFGQSTVRRQVLIKPCLDRLIVALQRVYPEKNMQVSVDVSAEIVFPGDESDLFELLGNLLDNAFKYGHQYIRVQAKLETNSFVVLKIDDDGPGIPMEARPQVLNRGARWDTFTDGQGLGLSLACELVKACQGELTIEKSELGGATIKCRIPL